VFRAINCRPVRQTYNGCETVLVYCRSHWETLGSLVWGIEGMSVWERVSIWHDKALMRWQVESSFSCSSLVIIPSFHFSHFLSFLIKSLPDGLFFPFWSLHCFTRCKVSLLPDSISFRLHLFFTFFLLTFSRFLPLIVLYVDVNSRSLTGHSVGWKCEHPSRGKKLLQIMSEYLQVPHKFW